MQPVKQIIFNTPTNRKTHGSTSTSARPHNRSEAQLRNMAAPKRVNALQWDLSTADEKRELLEISNSLEHTGSTVSEQTTVEQVETNLLKIRVINQELQELLIIEDNVNENRILGKRTKTTINQAISQLHNTGRKEPVNKTLPIIAQQEQSSLEKISNQFKQRFAEQASNKTAFHQLMRKSFGANYDISKAEGMRQKALKGDFSWLPKVKLVNTNRLADVSGNQSAGIGKGAYSTRNDTIYLNRQLLNSDPAEAEKTLTEEIGHAIDAKINVSDSKGDEGNIFSRLSYGEKISTEVLKALKSENDSGVIKINGEKIEVEYSKLSEELNRAGRRFREEANRLGERINREADRLGGRINREVNRSIRRFREEANRLGRTVNREYRRIRGKVKLVRDIEKSLKEGLARTAEVLRNIFRPKGPSRSLTLAEQNLARSVFGDSIDYSRVRIYNVAFLPFGLQGKDKAMAPDGNIYFNPKGSLYQTDFSLANAKAQELFIHEMTHVWQHQHGVDVFKEGMFEKNYNYELVEGKIFSDYGLEQQAEIVMDYFHLLGSSDSSVSEINRYRDIIPFVD